MRHDYFKTMLAGAGVGCVFGMEAGEVAETPAVGTPMAVGNCTVGAVAGATSENLVYSLTHLSDIGSEFSLMVQEAEAAANVVSACY